MSYNLATIFVCAGFAPLFQGGFPEIAGAALAGKNCGPILLVNAQQAFGNTSLQTIQGADSERTAAFLDSHADAVYWVDVLGGEYVMPESLIETIRTIIR